MMPTDDTDVYRQKLIHADAVILELRGVVAELRKQIEAQQAHIHRLVKISFGRGGERVEGPTLFDGMAGPETKVTPPFEPPAPKRQRPRSGRATAADASLRTCQVVARRST